MESAFMLIFLMFCIGAAGWLLFIWAVRSGQYDDIEGPKYRMLDDDDHEKTGTASDKSGESPQQTDQTPPSRN